MSAFNAVDHDDDGHKLDVLARAEKVKHFDVDPAYATWNYTSALPHSTPAEVKAIARALIRARERKA